MGKTLTEQTPVGLLLQSQSSNSPGLTSKPEQDESLTSGGTLLPEQDLSTRLAPGVDPEIQRAINPLSSPEMSPVPKRKCSSSNGEHKTKFTPIPVADDKTIEDNIMHLADEGSLLNPSIDAILDPQDNHICTRGRDPRQRNFWTTDDEFKNKQNDCGTSYLAKLRYQTRKGRVWAGFVFLSNIVTSVLFVCLCYAQEIESVHEPFDVQVTVYDAGDLPYSVISSLIYALSFVFLADYVFRFLAAVHKTKTVLAPKEVVDLVTIVLIQVCFWAYDREGHNARYDLEVASAFRVYFAVSLMSDLRSGHTRRRDAQISKRQQIQNQILDIACFSMSTIHIGAAIFMHVQNWDPAQEPKLEYFHCVYFVVTSMTTVGYGDISPTSNYAMAFTILLMLFLIIVLFPMITKAVDLTDEVTEFNSYPARYHHQPVILFQCGKAISVDRIKGVVEELYHPDQPQEITLCIVSADPPDSHMHSYLEEMKSVQPVIYVQGSLMDDDTCRRAGVEYAKAVILMPPEDVAVEEMDVMDEQLCIAAVRVRVYTDDMSMRKGMSTHPARIILVLNHIAHEFYFRDSFYGAVHQGYSNNTRVFSLSELQISSLAKGILCPAFMAFASNVGGRGDEFVLSGCKHTRDWVTEYMKGVGIDSYNIALPEELVDVDPQQLAAYIYAHGNGNMLFTIGNDRKSSKLLAPDLDEVQRTIDFLKELAQKEDPLAYITDWNGWAIACDEPVYTPAAERPPCILSEQVKDRVQRAYVQQGFEKAYGPIDHFARRHLVYNDAQGKISESLIQEPGSKLIKGLKNHVILIATNVEHASHFVQVLRQADVDQVHDIVIFANHIGDHEAHKVLSLFRGVYLINSETTAKNTDNGFLSRKSLIKLSVEAAHAVVITAAKCKDEDEAATHDLNHMCLRMLVGKLNPTAITILETDNFENVRYVVQGDEDCNAWSEPEVISSKQNSFMTKHWIRRSDAVNRASCVASGMIVEEDMFLQIATSAIHKATSNLRIVRSLLGGNGFDITLKCPLIDPKYAGKTFKELFVTACRDKQIVLALFRETSHGGQNYIYTCPAKDTVLRATDRLYVAFRTSWADTETETECRASAAVYTIGDFDHSISQAVSIHHDDFATQSLLSIPPLVPSDQL